MSTDNNFTKGLNENTIQSGTSRNRKKRDRKPEKTTKRIHSKLQFGGALELNGSTPEEPAVTKRPKLDTSGTKSGSPCQSQKSVTKEEIEPGIRDLNLEIQNDHLQKELEKLRH